jgi:5-methylthioadenosine/S-adenosylhomocysteine deaminase
MKTLAVTAKVKANDPTVITPKDALMAATRNGALAQGRMDCGVLKEGNKADLIVLRTDVPNMHPVHNMANNLVYAASGSDVVMTMVDGKVIYKDGDFLTLEMERTIFEAEAATAKILKML